MALCRDDLMGKRKARVRDLKGRPTHLGGAMELGGGLGFYNLQEEKPLQRYRGSSKIRESISADLELR